MTPHGWPQPIVAAEAGDLRQEFNAAGYFGPNGVRADVQISIIREGAPLPDRGFPDGTRSQILFYAINGEPVAIVHQYVLFGVIQGSGQPDPKRVIVRGDGTLTLRV